jgi:hypothetical protein
MVVLIVAALLVACGGEPDGQKLLESRCAKCHSLALVTGADKTAQGWEVTINRMIMQGAELTDAERDILVEYLTQEY